MEEEREKLLDSFVWKMLLQVGWGMSTEEERVLNMLFDDGSVLQIKYPLPTELVYGAGNVERSTEFENWKLPILKAALIRLNAEIALIELKNQ